MPCSPAMVAATRRGQRIPDLVGNLRVDQAWGSAQIMGALHQVGARYNASGLAFELQWRRRKHRAMR